MDRSSVEQRRAVGARTDDISYWKRRGVSSRCAYGATSAKLSEDGDPFVATDASAQAGLGDLVTYEASREAALLHHPWFVPVDHAIVGLVEDEGTVLAEAPHDDPWCGV